MNGVRILEWDYAVRPHPGESVCGDRAIVMGLDGQTVVAAVDGLGHGPDAALAAERAVEAIRTAQSSDVVALVQRCHAVLRETRGAALSLASLDGSARTLMWLGVGNVEGRLVGPTPMAGARAQSLMLAAGVVGLELPPLHPARLAIRRGDLLMLATDGIDPSFADSVALSGSCHDIAERVLTRHGRANDDALVVVARYLGVGKE